ncbi:MAG: hypothetical protein K0S07_895 [Chlamydiales bacterium]|jgi:hypothetical protein|nr:hypothetical protein [Chlamydiales bacterium]
MIPHDSIGKFMEATTTHSERQLFRLGKIQRAGKIVEEIQVVPLKNTSWLERLKAKFGFGPLSLSNISRFIQNNQEQFQQSLEEMDQAQQGNFATKIYYKCNRFNAHHRLKKVESVIFELLFNYMSLASEAAAMKDQTYLGDDLGNVDFSHANKKLGLAYVIDGTGHNDPLMKPILETHVTHFKERYEAELAAKMHAGGFTSLEEAKNLFMKHIKSIASDISSDGSRVKRGIPLRETPPPAASLVQIVKVEDKTYLLSFERSDTCVLLMKNGQLDDRLVEDRRDRGLGVDHAFKNSQAIPDETQLASFDQFLQVTELSEGDEVFGFSDGIGDFITTEDFQELIAANTDRQQLLAEIKAKIVAKGLEKYNSESGQQETATPSLNKKDLKFHDQEHSDPAKPDFKKEYVDDISLFCMKVN